MYPTSDRGDVISEGVISSRRNRRIVAAAMLVHSRERKERGQTLIEGHHVVGEAIRAGAGVRTIFFTAGTDPLPISDTWIDTVEVTVPVMERIATTVNPRGPVAVIDVPDSAPLERVRTVVLCGLADPGNAGALIRSAAAFGFRVAVTKGSVDPWAPKVLRSAAGAHFHTSIAVVDTDPVPDVKAAGLCGVALVAGGGRRLEETIVETPAILVGNESRGLPSHIVDAADYGVSIAMDGAIESLNAAIAGAIAMHHFANR